MHPKALFLYGTNKEDGTPDFSLFTWITGCWNGEARPSRKYFAPKINENTGVAFL